MKDKKVYLASVALMALLLVPLTACNMQQPSDADTSSSSIQSESMEVEKPLESKPIVSEWTLSTLTEQHLEFFKLAIQDWPEQILAGNFTVQQADESQSDFLEALIIEGELPSNGQGLFAEWKQSTGYYEQFASLGIEDNTQQPSDESQQPSSSQQQSGSSSQSTEQQQPQSSKPTGTPSNKPQPSTSQQQQQQQQASGDEEFHKPTPEELEQMDKDAGLKPGADIDWSLWE